MQVLMINGSPHEKGCTYTSLLEVAGQIEKQGIETTFFHIGDKAIRGCIGCGACRESGYCVFKDDSVNACIDLAKSADGMVIGSPVYYAGANGSLCAFLDRMFFGKSAGYAYKPGAAVRELPPWRCKCRVRPAQQVLHHLQHARRPLAVLERDPWAHA